MSATDSLVRTWIAYKRLRAHFRILRKERKESRDRFFYEAGGQVQTVDRAWYRGEHCNFYPVRKSFSEPDAIARHVALGWLPDQPFITKESSITAFGSCFARHVSEYLINKGYNVFGNDRSKEAYVIRCSEGMVNTAAISQQLLWAYGKANFQENLWYDKSGSVAIYSEEIRLQTREIFDRTDVFIITLGLSEVWYSKATGDVFWGPIRKDLFDPERHGFKVLTVNENKQNIRAIYDCVREHRPEATLIFTLSPVPLIATFRPVSCVTANSVSKAVLRVAIDEFMREHPSDRKLFYFPSYEIVKEFHPDPYLEDLRHIKPEVVQMIMGVFQRHYLI